jgi:N-terminal acetyltransferase B complex non-catalytic subunit
LTSDEVSFLNFADALSSWLEPYHTHARPPPAVVLAEAAKQTERKTGHVSKTLDSLPRHGSTTNGRKKDEEAPTVKEHPEILTLFFDCMDQFELVLRKSNTDTVAMQTRFKEVVEANRLPSEVLHVITLTQEVLYESSVFGTTWQRWY